MTIMPTSAGADGTTPAAPVAAQLRREHLVDLRLSIPVPGRRLYVTFLAGPERRAAERRRQERRQHPLKTVGNVLFVALAALAFYAVAAVGILMYSKVLTF
jgi:hypothetical protein